jgi:hypothetical protein
MPYIVYLIYFIIARKQYVVKNEYRRKARTAGHLFEISNAFSTELGHIEFDETKAACRHAAFVILIAKLATRTLPRNKE